MDQCWITASGCWITAKWSNIHLGVFIFGLFFLIRIYTLTNVPPVQRLMDLNRNGAESLSLPMCCTDPSYYFFYFQIIFGPTWNWRWIIEWLTQTNVSLSCTYTEHLMQKRVIKCKVYHCPSCKCKMQACIWSRVNSQEVDDKPILFSVCLTGRWCVEVKSII